ncbi:hypothetical protein CF327_g3978 [Tilletia walkeri]|nr:hypothetical protein CF327_g3978 [Tilletia walkeri]
MTSNITNISAGTNVTFVQGCPRLAPNTTLTLADLTSPDRITALLRDPSISPLDRQCGYHGGPRLDALSRCCANSTQIESSNQFDGKCGFSCPFNGTLAEWRTCLAADDSLEIFCLKSVKLEQVYPASAGAGTRRVRQPRRTSFGWTLVVVGLALLAMLVPTASAAPPSVRDFEDLPWYYQRTICQKTKILEGPYVAVDVALADVPNFTQRVEVTTGPQVVTSQSVNVTDRIISNIALDRMALSFLLCTEVILPNSTANYGSCSGPYDLETAYEVWAPNNTVVEFTLKPAYVCIKAQLSKCLTPPYNYNSTYTDNFSGLYCLTRQIHEFVPLAFWSVSQTPLS